MKRKVASGLVNLARVRNVRGGSDLSLGRAGKAVIYWMSRDQRAHENWALLYAQQVAMEHQTPLVVAFNLCESFPGATLRSFSFMLRGLMEVEQTLREYNIEFVLLRGQPEETVPDLAEKMDASLVVCDMSPLRVAKEWKANLTQSLSPTVALHEVDAHNIVPCWLIPSQETAARTIRPKLWKLAPEFLEAFPPLEKHPHGSCDKSPSLDADKVLSSIADLDTSVKPTSLQPGYAAGQNMLETFFRSGLKKYDAERNKPMVDAQSGASAYFHFGQISAQRAILDAQAAKKANSSATDGANGFIEEAFIRRELAENFCLYNSHYDSVKGAAKWAQETLQVHAKDKRSHVYSLEQFEAAKSHDKLWNAAQIQLRNTGKMHGFMRMYWCKKILEWAESPEEALRISIYLNDKYSLDGRDPNGYVGCMWSVCGVHDMGFKERDVFGKIRFMNYDGCKRKFKQAGIDQYCKANAKIKD